MPRTKRREKLLTCKWCGKDGIRPCNYLRHYWPCKEKHVTAFHYELRKNKYPDDIG